MKMNYNIIILTIFISLTMFGCNQNSDKQIQEKPDFSTISTAKVTPTVTKMTEVYKKPNFDVVKFVTLTDSLLTKIQGRPIGLTIKIDTISANKTDKISFYSSLFSSDKCLIKRYSFDPGKGSRELRIWFVEATYQDSISTNKAFEELHRQSGKVDVGNDYFPGLTYTNDYVIKSYNKIYWLNSGCTYAFYNHQKLKHFMLQSLQVDNIQDSIWCKCGQPKCSLLKP
jgi:hypothetical protein